jgi:hypothetical protein
VSERLPVVSGAQLIAALGKVACATPALTVTLYVICSEDQRV